MKVELQNSNLHQDGRTQELIERQTNKLRKRLKRYDPDSCRLVIRLSYNKSTASAACSLELHVRQKVLVAKKEAASLSSAVKEAFATLVREFEKHRFKINRRVATAAPRLTAAAGGENRQEARLLLENILARKRQMLQRAAQHEVIHHQVTGELEPGELTPTEVVDEAVLRVLGTARPNESTEDLERELLRQIIAAARDLTVQIAGARQREVSIDQAVESFSDAQESASLGEEMLYFYEPDESLRLEDLIEDPAAITPEAVVENSELQRFLYHALSKLPEDVRTAFTLTAIEGFTEEEVSMVLRRPVETIQRQVKEAGEALSKTLRVDEKTVTPQQVVELYKTLKELPVSASADRPEAFEETGSGLQEQKEAKEEQIK
ncbi:MAG: hypothetical protein D6743_19470 [Calditrichaeota bacterium]|nr:MAG: hypothetical protein D6743_19470 [Calditrichota bacterium]